MTERLNCVLKPNVNAYSIQQRCDYLCEEMNISKIPDCSERTLGMLQKKYDYYLTMKYARNLAHWKS